MQTRPCLTVGSPLKIAPHTPDPGNRRQRLNASGSITSGLGSGGLGSGGLGNTTVLRTLEQSGGAKIRLPRSEPGALSAVLLNTAGGLTGDDRIHWHAGAEAGSRLTLATAASEKIYRTHGPAARQHTFLEVGSDARLDWLPQETILFDGARLERTLEARLASDATLLMVEAIAFGRQASGESLRTIEVQDKWRIYRGDRLLHAEAFRLQENDDDQQGGAVARHRGTLHGAGAMATVLLCTPASAESLAGLAATINGMIDDKIQNDRLSTFSSRSNNSGDSAGQDDPWSTGAASALEGRLVIRLIARSGHELREILLPCLEMLQGDVSLPRVWYV